MANFKRLSNGDYINLDLVTEIYIKHNVDGGWELVDLSIQYFMVGGSSDIFPEEFETKEQAQEFLDKFLA